MTPSNHLNGTSPAIVAGALILALPTMNAYANDRAILEEVVISAPVSEVWRAWSTEEGVKSFFSRGANIELHPDGLYEILFFPDSPAGQRGAEGMRLLVVEPGQRLVFSWNAPRKWPEIRRQRTVVEVSLEPRGAATVVRLQHTGWGVGGDWDAVFGYFSRAWPVVLRRLQHRFDTGPIDWDNAPEHLLFRG